MKSVSIRAGWIGFGDISAKVFGFITTIYLARILDVESYGLITFSMAFLGYGFWLSDLGLQHIGAREIAKEPIRRDFRFKEIFVLKCILGAAVIILLHTVLPFTSLRETESALLRSFFWVIIPFSLSFEWYFMGKQNFRIVALSKAAQTGLYLLTLLLFVRSSLDLKLIPVLFLVSFSIIASAIAITALTAKPVFLAFRKNSLAHLFQKSLHVGIGSLLAQTVQLFPPIVIGLFLSMQATGLYGAAYRVLIVFMILDKVVSSIWLPTLSKKWNENPGSVRNNMTQITQLVLNIGFGTSILLASNSGMILQLLYGNDYAGGAFILSILAFFIPLTLANSVFSFGLISIGKEKAFFKATLLGGMLTAAFILIAISTKNLQWIALSVVIGEFSIMAFNLFSFSKHIDVKLLKWVLMYSIAGVLSFGLMIFAPSGIGLFGITSFLIFQVICFSTGMLNFNSLKWLLQQVKS